jgi:hypothetical protein
MDLFCDFMGLACGLTVVYSVSIESNKIYTELSFITLSLFIQLYINCLFSDAKLKCFVLQVLKEKRQARQPASVAKHTTINVFHPIVTVDMNLAEVLNLLKQ